MYLKKMITLNKGYIFAFDSMFIPFVMLALVFLSPYCRSV